MALETLNIDYIKDKDNKTVFPVTHSDAIIGGLSKKGYNINDAVYNNNWDNVINTGIYYSSSPSNSTNRPQLLFGTTNIDVTYDFIEVIRIGSSAFQLAKISDGLNADYVVAYREFTNVTDTGAGSKGTWKSNYYTSSITGSAVLTDVTTDNQTLKLSGITSYSDLDGRIIVMYQESNASAKLPLKIRINNLAYVPLYNLDGTVVDQSTFGNKRVPMLVSYSTANSCFYLVGGGSSGGKYIPLTGTEKDKPVTGMIKIDNDKGGIVGITGINDEYRIIGRSTGESKGFLEISTADNGNEPIYIRQYDYTKIVTDNSSWTGTNYMNGEIPAVLDKVRTLTLLDSKGDTRLPQKLIISEENNTRIVMGSSSINSGVEDQFSWIDHRKKDDSLISSIGFDNEGMVMALKGIIGLGSLDTSKKGNTEIIDNKKYLKPRSKMQWNEDEECIEFVFA